MSHSLIFCDSGAIFTDDYSKLDFMMEIIKYTQEESDIKNVFWKKVIIQILM